MYRFLRDQGQSVNQDEELRSDISFGFRRWAQFGPRPSSSPPSSSSFLSYTNSPSAVKPKHLSTSFL